MQFSNAVFEEANPSNFFIRFYEDQAFEVLDIKKNVLVIGQVGIPVKLFTGGFTIAQVKDVSLGRLYSLCIVCLS